MSSSNQQRREAAKRKLDRQQAHRAQRAQRRKQVAAVTAAVVVIAVIAAIVLVTVASTTSSAPNAAGPPSVTTTPPGPCTFTATPEEPASRPVSLPTETNPPKTGTVSVTVNTTQGVLPLTLNRAEAPCTVASFVHLATAGFFNNTPCHRLINMSGLKALQCGDPTGSGTGGPGYTIPDEPPNNLAPGQQGAAIYPKGSIAMANTGQPNSGGSQFFLVYEDSQLPPEYTVFGTIGAPGIQALQKVAAGGDDGSLNPSPGGGKPKLATTLQTVTVNP
ncbi:peptidylprolyl isomerase [Pseudonocardia spinosispora]|uniref:peptidylprolyl isomerase n=1 Tax=Pseudonocardia spinosispora TaxID=103441 RepID=UPI000409F7D2|nr:peptidylprolyl isomerase [Pseudonocardia spinosispora]